MAEMPKARAILEEIAMRYIVTVAALILSCGTTAGYAQSPMFPLRAPTRVASI